MDFFESIKKFHLICESIVEETLDPSTITDFYLAYYLYQKIDDDESQSLLKYVIIDVRQAYLNAMKPILIKQLQKYHSRRRIVGEYNPEDFSRADYEKLYTLMKQSRRSDMNRINQRWNDLAELLKDLQANDRNVKEMAFLIDRINNTIHNTGESMLSKFPNRRQLEQTFDFAHKATIRQLINKSSNSDLKEIASNYRFMDESVSFLLEWYA